MRKDLLLAAIATTASGVQSSDKLNYNQALHLVDIEFDTASKFACVKYLERTDVISSEVATELNAEIYRQQNQ